jgi:hypothetical protein
MKQRTLEFEPGDLVGLSLDGTTTIGRHSASASGNYGFIGVVTKSSFFRGKTKKVWFADVYWPHNGTTQTIHQQFLAHCKPENL